MEFKQLSLLVLGFIVLIALVGIVIVFSSASATGQIFAYPMEGGFGQGEINWPSAAKTLMYECQSPFPGKAEGEFQKKAYAYDARTAAWLQDRFNFVCAEV